VEFASPPFDQPPQSPIPFIPTSAVMPDHARAGTATTYMWAKREGDIAEVSTSEQVDRLIKFVPTSSGAKW
jgi:hypothetical protein